MFTFCCSALPCLQAIDKLLHDVDGLTHRCAAPALVCARSACVSLPRQPGHTVRLALQKITTVPASFDALGCYVTLLPRRVEAAERKIAGYMEAGVTAADAQRQVNARAGAFVQGFASDVDVAFANPICHAHTCLREDKKLRWGTCKHGMCRPNFIFTTMCCHVCSMRTAGGEAAAAHPKALQITLQTPIPLFPAVSCLLQAEKLRLRIHKLQARYTTAEEICENFERGHSLRRRCVDSVYLLPSAACTQSPCSTHMIGCRSRLPAYPSNLATAETQPSMPVYQLLGFAADLGPALPSGFGQQQEVQGAAGQHRHRPVQGLPALPAPAQPHGLD